MCYRTLKNNTGAVSIILGDKDSKWNTDIKYKDGDLFWHVKFTDKMYNCYASYLSQNPPLFLEKQAEEARKYIDDFLIRINKLRAYI